MTAEGLGERLRAEGCTSQVAVTGPGRELRADLVLANVTTERNRTSNDLQRFEVFAKLRTWKRIEIRPRSG